MGSAFYYGLLIVAKSGYDDIIKNENAWVWLNEEQLDSDYACPTLSADGVLILLSAITGNFINHSKISDF
jgi:hypothetical protein